jgi:hypothetical protein
MNQTRRTFAMAVSLVVIGLAGGRLEGSADEPLGCKACSMPKWPATSIAPTWWPCIVWARTSGIFVTPLIGG